MIYVFPSSFNIHFYVFLFFLLTLPNSDFHRLSFKLL